MSSTRDAQRKRKRRSASQSRKRQSVIDVVSIDSRLKHHKHKSRHSQHHRPSLPTPQTASRHSHVHHHHHHHIHSHEVTPTHDLDAELQPRRPSKLRGINGLKLNLAAAPIATQSNSRTHRNVRKARSKPAPNTMDLTRRSARPFELVQSRKQKHRGSNTPQSHSHSARFRKRVSAPIVVPSSISGSVNFEPDDAAPQTPLTPMTPYYHNLRRAQAPQIHSHAHTHIHARTPQTVPAQPTHGGATPTYDYAMAMAATKKRGSVDLDAVGGDEEMAHEHEHEQYLDEREINEMIRSFRRISKSRPRAYSKSRRVSQKLFGLMESLSFSKELSVMERPSPPPPTLSPSPSSPEEREQPEETSLDASETCEPTEVVQSAEVDGAVEEEVAEGVQSREQSREQKASYQTTLLRYGYEEVKVIAKSLQGVVVEARRTEDHADFETDEETVIIKITSKQLHSAKLSNKHGKALSVQEDIIKEKKLLMYLTANQPPESLVKFLGFFSDSAHYFLVMENGGCDFFDWIVKCHGWIRAGKLSLKQWKLYIADLMSQIVEFVRWLHCKMKVVHLDISLENMLIKHNKFKSDGNGGIRLSRKMQVKICDFGLAEYFSAGNEEGGFACTKYVGKTHYKAPKVYGKKQVFDARKADIWSLGVSFFMMMVGAPPYKLPTANDDHFPMIEKNDVMAILRRWGREHYIDEHAEHLLNRMLCVDEATRIDTEALCIHRFFARNRSRNTSKSKSGKRRSLNWKKRLSQASAQAQPQPPVNSPVNAVPLRVLMESANHNIFQHLVMSEEDGQLFRYRKRKLTST